LPSGAAVHAVVMAKDAAHDQVTDADPAARRRGRPRSPDAKPESKDRRGRRERQAAAEAAAAAAAADSGAGAVEDAKAGGGAASVAATASVLTPQAVSHLVKLLDDYVQNADEAVRLLGERVLPVGLVAAVLRSELGAVRGGEVVAKIERAAAEQRRAAGVEGPDVVPVAAVRDVMSAARAVLGALQGGASGGVAVRREHWFDR